MALVKCKECEKEISSGAKSCPNCGAKQKKFSIIRFVGGAFLLFLFVTFMVGVIQGAGSSSGTATASTSTSSATTPSELQAVDVALAAGQHGMKVVRGNVTNTTGKNLSYVQVEINLFDASGVQIGSTVANVNNLAPSIKWSFEAPVLDDRANSMKVAGITSF